MESSSLRKTQKEHATNRNKKTNISFCDFLHKYYGIKELELEKSSFNGYKNILENHIYPYFRKKDILLIDLSAEEINQYLICKLNQDLSPSTVKKHREVIGQALRAAYKRGLMTIDLMSEVEDICVEPSARSNKLLPAHLLETVLLAAYDTDIYIPVMLTARYGLDRSEILGLRWSDIDFASRNIHIQNVVVKGCNSAFDIHPANEKTERTIPVFSDDLEALLVEKQKQAKTRSENRKYCRKYYDYVNVTCNGYLLGPDNLSKKLNDLLCRERVERVTFSELRKVYAASLFSMGFNSNAVCTWLGVESISTVGCELNSELIQNQMLLIKTALELYRKGS